MEIKNTNENEYKLKTKLKIDKHLRRLTNGKLNFF